MGAELLRECSPLQTCHMYVSLVTCHMSRVTCNVSCVTKVAKIADSWHLSFTFGHWNMFKWAHSSGLYRRKNKKKIFCKKKSKMGEHWDLRFLPLTRTFILDFLQLYLIKLIFFYKTECACIVFCYMCVKYELIWTYLNAKMWVLRLLPLQWAQF